MEKVKRQKFGTARAWLLGGMLAVAAAAGCNKGPKEVKLDLASIGETMQFDKKELTVPAGAKVTITFKNNATNAAMTHNFVLVQPGMVDLVGAAAATVSAAENHVPKHSAIIFASQLSKPGETLTFTFDAPKDPGNYEFLCTTPGHFALMRGKLIVQ